MLNKNSMIAYIFVLLVFSSCSVSLKKQAYFCPKKNLPLYLILLDNQEYYYFSLYRYQDIGKFYRKGNQIIFDSYWNMNNMATSVECLIDSSNLKEMSIDAMYNGFSYNSIGITDKGDTLELNKKYPFDSELKAITFILEPKSLDIQYRFVLPKDGSNYFVLKVEGKRHIYDFRSSHNISKDRAVINQSKIIFNGEKLDRLNNLNIDSLIQSRLNNLEVFWEYKESIPSQKPTD